MCGIYGYVGNRLAAPIILKGLRSLEYRGYDGAGIATVGKHGLNWQKKAGKISEGLGKLPEIPPGHTGIGHTRWATHGPATDANAHPHFDERWKIALVHNGIIENYKELRGLQRDQSDTRALAWKIGEFYRQLKMPQGVEAFQEAVRRALSLVRGEYAIAAVCSDCPDVIVAARKGRPLLMAHGHGENFITSDIAALETIPLRVVPIPEGVPVVIRSDSSIEGEPLDRHMPEETSVFSQHVTLAEIREQPQSVARTISQFDPDILLAFPFVQSVRLIGCGTSRHAAMVGARLIETFGRMPAQVEDSSEFEPVNYGSVPRLTLALSQSGETADTLAAVRKLKGKAIGLCNVPGSSLTREAHKTFFFHAGTERGVAATKTFTSQVVWFNWLTALLFDDDEYKADVKALPQKIAQVLATESRIEDLARKYAKASSMFFIGRGYGYPTALEAALKVKELAYIHAEGLPAGELKHGPLALISEEVPTVAILGGRDTSKTISNLEEIQTRGGPVISVTEDSRAPGDIIKIPSVHECLIPVVASVALQLFAYYLALHRGCDIDYPRNLAKSVTVE